MSFRIPLGCDLAYEERFDPYGRQWSSSATTREARRRWSKKRWLGGAPEQQR
jgi:hypothetical protein